MDVQGIMSLAINNNRNINYIMVITRELTDSVSASTASDIQLGSCVTEIGQGAFSGYTNIGEVEFPDSLTTIGVGAFSGSSITSVEFPSGLTSISDSAFNSCYTLGNFTLPSSLTTIGASAFTSCSGMTELTIPSGVTSIGDNAFKQSKNLQRINVSATTVPTLGSNALNETNNCTIYVPFSSYDDYIAAQSWQNYRSRIFYEGAPFKVRFINSSGEASFVKCDSSTIVSRPSSIPSGITSTTFGECVTDFDTKSFSGISLGDVVIPSNVKYINSTSKSYAFYSASATSINFAEGIEEIGYSTFEYFKCDSPIVLPSTLTKMDSYAFYGLKAPSVTINGSKTLELNQYAFKYSTITSATISNIKTLMGFSDCGNLKTANISNVETLGYNAFSNCGSLTDVSITTTGSTILSGSTFTDCKSLSAVTLGNGVTSIGYGEFLRCSGLTSINIPSTLTSIGESAFYGTGLVNVTIPDTVTSLGASAFYGTKSLSSCTIGSGITSLDRHVFYESTVNSVSLPNTLTTLGYKVFYNSGLLSLTLPNSVTSVGSGLCQDSTSLSSVTLSSSMASIPQDAFNGCTSLKSVEIPNGIMSIEQTAFRNCSAMTSVIIPESVISIGASAFTNCSGLNSIIVGRATPPTIGAKVFDGSTCFIYVPQASYDLYVNAENWSTYADRIFAVGQNYKAMLFGSTNKIIQCNDNTTLTLSELTSNYADTINVGNCVTAIGNSAFTSSNQIETVAISSGVTSIGNSAFYNKKTLKTVSGGQGLTSIGDEAFMYCSGFTSITLPDSLATIGEWAFYGTSLTTIVIPSGVTSIGRGAFQSSALTSVTFEGSTPPTIGDNTITGYHSLFHKRIPIYVPCTAYNDYMTAWAGASTGSSDGRIIDYLIPNGQYTKNEEISGEYLCENGNKYKKIGHYVSSDNINWCLQNYVVGDLIVEGDSDCSPFLHIEWNSNCGTNCNNSGYTYTKYCGETDKTIVGYNDIPYSQGYISAITIGDCVKTVEEVFVPSCTSIKSLSLGKNITSIGYRAFENIGITSLELPSTLTEIGYSAFVNCSGLTSIICLATTPPTLGVDVTYGGIRVFSGTNNCNIYVPCESVSAYKAAWSTYADRIHGIQPCQEEIKASIQYSNGSAYTTTCGGDNIVSNIPNVSSATSAVIGDCATEIGDTTFNFASNLTAITIGNNVKKIGSMAIRGTKITSITLPSTLTTLGDGVLENNTGLTSVVIPSGVTSIPNECLMGCTNLRSVVIPSGVTSVGGYAFSNCSGLTSVSNLDNVESIGDSAFYQCKGLTAMTIGNSVTSIGSAAFNYCTNLRSITIYATTPPSIAYDTFYNTNSCIIYVPEEALTAYKAATWWSDYASRIQAIPTS